MRFLRNIIIALAVILICFTGYKLISGLIKKSTKKDVAVRAAITDYAEKEGSYVRLTIGGVINSEEKHRTIRITVDANKASVDVFQGYRSALLKSQSFPNNKVAYNVFLHALNTQAFTRERKTRNTDITGMCPLGNRYQYEVFSGAEQVMNRWSGTCGTVGTFGGNVGGTIALFQKQIPNYSQFISDVFLN